METRASPTRGNASTGLHDSMPTIESAVESTVDQSRASERSPTCAWIRLRPRRSPPRTLRGVSKDGADRHTTQRRDSTDVTGPTILSIPASL